MAFQIEDRDGYTYVKVQEGRLDIFGASVFKDKMISLIENQENKNIVLDISKCSFCDASGLSAIHTAHNLCKYTMGMFIVTGIQACIEELIRICMLDTVWLLAKDMDEIESHLKVRV